jgi:predicted dehydrogenase
MTDVRVGVVGLGLMGRVHAGNAADVGADIVAGTDVATDAREKFVEEFDVPTYESHDAMLEQEAIDAVVITTPNRFHEAAAVAALEDDCYVLVEKPLAHTLESATRIADASADSAGYCMVGFHNRFSPASKATRGYRDAGRFGDIDHIEATYVRRRGIPATGSWFTNRELSGGGSLIDVGVHVIDLAMDILEFPEVVEVSGITRSTFGAREDYSDPEGFASSWDGTESGFDVDDSVTAFLRLASGKSISLEVAWATNRTPANELVVRGTEAGAQLEFEGSVVEMFETGTVGVDHHVTSEIDARGGPDGHVEEMRHFLSAAAAGEPVTMNTAEEGLEVQRIVDGIYESSETGRAVRLDEPQDDHGD